MSTLWTELAARAGLTLTEAQQSALSRYIDLLLAGNATMNLTRITDRGAAEIQHVGDALTLLPLLPSGPHRLADVGSGGGVPGIPLAIARPDAQVLLIESTRKKAKFLRDTAAALSLSNVQVTESRAEDVSQPAAPPAGPAAPDASKAQSAADAPAGGGPLADHTGPAPALRESFDVAVARAVATLVWLTEWCLPLVKKGGVMLAMKGPKVAEELPAARKTLRALGGGEPVLHPVQFSGAEHHVIVEIRKVGRTDSRYPRPATRAKGKPMA